MRLRLPALARFWPCSPSPSLRAAARAARRQVPADAVALVGDQPITRAAFASMLAANRQSYRLKGQAFPAAGTAAVPDREEQGPRPARPGGRARAAGPVAVRDRDRRRAGRPAAGAAPGTHVRQAPRRGSERRSRSRESRRRRSGRGSGKQLLGEAALPTAERPGLGLRRRGRALVQEPPQRVRAAGHAPRPAHPRRHPRAGRRAGAQAAKRRRLRRAREALLDRRCDGARPAASSPGASCRARRSPRSTGSPSR